MRRPLVMLLAILVVPMIAPAQDSMAADPVAQLVSRLDLERYKATSKGLTNLGDRRQGTDPNPPAGGGGVEKRGAAPPPPPPRGGGGGEGGGGPPQVAAATVASAPRPASTAIRSGSPTPACARSMRNPLPRARAKRCTAPRSARRTPGR